MALVSNGGPSRSRTRPRSVSLGNSSGDDVNMDHDDIETNSILGLDDDPSFGGGYGLEDGLLGDASTEALDRFAIFMPAVQNLVNAIGGYEDVRVDSDSTGVVGAGGRFERVYRPGDSVLAVLKDLKRLWRKDDTDDERTVARCMARAGLMREVVVLVQEVWDRGEWGRKVALVACESALLRIFHGLARTSSNELLSESDSPRIRQAAEDGFRAGFSRRKSVSRRAGKVY